MIYTYTSPRPTSTASTTTDGLSARRALEDPAFPFEELSEIAELESWRKEINRPLYHLHKWWAQRLGSVFRGILIGAVEPDAAGVMPAFFDRTRYPGVVAFDPFMGSGTTVGEALKLGMRAIGRDINPVAYFAVRNALSQQPRDQVIATFEAIERDLAPRIRRYYLARIDGTEVDVLYYFWVKVVPCPACSAPVDLFSSYVFARHAYPKRHPQARVLCPACGEINEARYDAGEITCCNCRHQFDPQAGPARGTRATCPRCATAFPIAQAIRRRHAPPEHRLYAKLVLLPDGTKAYRRADPEDLARYKTAERELSQRPDAFPVVPIEPGYNTNQVLNYHYRFWHEMFNARQLLGLSLLAERIRAIEDRDLRELFACLFSGVLEFNNMFASYKGEGTGAVRHMFAHHVLKPERAPLEANLWGTPKSSGAFSTLFRSRLLRALDYRDRPFEVRPLPSNGKQTGEKVYDLSAPVGRPIAKTYGAFATQEDGVYLSCGDSAATDLPEGGVDLVVTDPPFFDNVHYSELADFFFVWQRHILGPNGHRTLDTTRSTAEVQHGDAAAFTDRLGAVLGEAHRVLKDEGLLVFTYHHSRPDGWRAILAALGRAGFGITAAHPIKAEMSVAMPKTQAKEPIDLDVILVCRKRSQLGPQAWNGAFWATVVPLAERQVARLRAGGRRLSRNDVRVIVTAQLLRPLSLSHSVDAALALLDANQGEIETHIERIYLDDAANRG